MDFAPMVATLALAWKIVDFAKQLRVRDWNAVVTQLSVWLAGVVVMFLLASTDFASAVRVGGMAVSRMNAGSLLLVGLSVGASASVLYDFKRALDHTDSAAQPTLLTGEVPIVPPVTTEARPARAKA